jgi:4-carboxymuconolactone decarboxylase
MKSKKPQARLDDIPEEQMSAEQRALRDAILSGPRGSFKFGGPFAVWLHAPEFGKHAQQLGAFCRYQTSLPPRLSEFAIIVTARLWRAQYEWEAHAPIAQRAGVSAATIKEIKAGRRPSAAPDDELAIYDFVQALYRDRRVNDATYRQVHDLLGDVGTVELVGILGYYALISMTLNVFRVPTESDKAMPFREPVRL